MGGGQFLMSEGSEIRVGEYASRALRRLVCASFLEEVQEVGQELHK